MFGRGSGSQTPSFFNSPASTSCATCWPMPAARAGAFAQDGAEGASARWRPVADQLRTKAPKLAALTDQAEHDVLAYLTFPREHRSKLHSTNPIRAAACRDQATHQRRRHLPQR